MLRRNLIFIHGKGGVGKTLVSQAIALELSKTRAKTLWISIEDPTRPPGELTQVNSALTYLNCDFSLSFEEYIGMKIGAAGLARLFLQNKLIKYLAKAAPGIHELVLLGKIWHERLKYTHVVVDLPSTGYGLAMFQSTENFARLFQGGPLYRDALAMMETFNDPEATSHLIVSLPEEMPLRESIELNDYLLKMMPSNPARFVANRIFPHSAAHTQEIDHTNPYPQSAEEYFSRRAELEKHNLRIWRDAGISFEELPFVPPAPNGNSVRIIESLGQALLEKGYL